jgi:hypothetical protein
MPSFSFLLFSYFLFSFETISNLEENLQIFVCDLTVSVVAKQRLKDEEEARGRCG